MAAFMRVTRNNELVIARAAGVSVWQFMLPAIAVAFLMGSFIVTIYNPVASVMTERYTQLEAKRSEEHTSELQSLMRISYAVFCLKKKKTNQHPHQSLIL